MSEKKKRTFENHDGFILKEGKKYLWSGISDGLYSCMTWTKGGCKIQKIKGDKIHVFDKHDNKIYKYRLEHLKNMSIVFYKKDKK